MVGHRYWMPPPRQFQPMFQVSIEQSTAMLHPVGMIQLEMYKRANCSGKTPYTSITRQSNNTNRIVMAWQRMWNGGHLANGGRCVGYWRPGDQAWAVDGAAQATEDFEAQILNIGYKFLGVCWTLLEVGWRLARGWDLL